MKAFILDRYGSKVALRLGETADPEVGEEDVLVEVHAAGVNLLDSKVRSGEFKLILPYRVPIVLGHDMAGVVVRAGARDNCMARSLTGYWMAVCLILLRT